MEKKSVSHPPLPCGGIQCEECGRCCDWRYTGHPQDWEWIRNFRNWDANEAERWRNGAYHSQFALKNGVKCNRSGHYTASSVLRWVTFGAFDGSALLGHLCVCDPHK